MVSPRRSGTGAAECPQAPFARRPSPSPIPLRRRRVDRRCAAETPWPAHRRGEGRQTADRQSWLQTFLQLLIGKDLKPRAFADLAAAMAAVHHRFWETRLLNGMRRSRTERPSQAEFAAERHRY